ncbi:hypothetical protein FACS1894184_15720 [Clostridia bacterium]|nr:hypothetical protein FACS1894184_15720 [Clostridia bacterium]
MRINLLLPLNPILGSLFNRDLSNFTGRTRIWGAAIAKIALNPIVGYGRNDSANQQLMGLNVTAPHSQYLDTLLYSGIIGLILLFSALILASLNEVKENRQHNIPLVNGIGSLLIMMQFESYDSYATFPLIIALVVLIGCKDVKKRYIQYGIN